MTTFQPPALWPFEPGITVYGVRYDKTSEPPARIPAVVLCVRGTSASVQRDDKQRVTSMRLRHLALRGYCAVCPAPAIVGPDGQLVCSKCQAPAVDAPPPDELVWRWFPLDEYHASLLMRCAFKHPGWSYSAVSHAAINAMRAPHDAMLTRLGLSRIYVGNNPETVQEEIRMRRLMDLYAALGDDAAFLATYQDLCQLQACATAARRSERRPLIVDWEDTYLLAQMSRTEEEETHAPPIVRAAGDTEPDTDTATPIDTWLDAQFRRAA